MRKNAVDKYLGMFKEITTDIEGVRYCQRETERCSGSESMQKIWRLIITSVDAVKDRRFQDVHSIRLWYVECPIIQDQSLRFPWMSSAAAVGGGGRYDEMIGKFTGQNNTCACGFSIGFERIVMLLLERGYRDSDKRKARKHI